jgi:peroxiredoxin Q/BCP
MSGALPAALRRVRRQPVLGLLAPSALLVPVGLLYLHFGGTPHFFLHSLAGWDLGLILLLAAGSRGWPRSRWEGVLALALALYAMGPDFIYMAGPAHRDWMDVFLFHVALDEILPYALGALAALWVVLLVAYNRFRAGTAAAAVAGSRPRLRLLLGAALAVVAVLALVGVATERSASRPLVAAGQQAPDFALPATDGRTVSLVGQRGHAVVLAFVPSVRCGFCAAQLRTLQETLPDLQARGAVVLAVSTDETPLQRAAAERLNLGYPILSEAPIVEQHPVGSAYGVYHLAQAHPGPVDVNAVVAIDSGGIVRAVRVAPGRAIAAGEIRAVADASLH